jgi:ribose transport system substrate-binding protein
MIGSRSKRAPRLALVMLAITAAVVATVASTASAGSAGATRQGKVKEIAFFGFAKANSFANATWTGVQQASKARGAKATFFDPNFNAQTQVTQIQDAITSGKYQAFIIQANDGNAVVPAVKSALKAGITVVAEFTPIGPRYDTDKSQVPGMIFVGESPVANGVGLATMGVQACKGKNPCNVAYLEGFKALPLDNARTDSVKKTLAKAKNVKVVASVEGGYTAASGLKAAQDVIQAHPDVNVIIGSAQAIQGAEQAVKSAKLTGKVKLVGNGGSCQALAGVRSGRWFGTYIIAERSSGAKAAELAIKKGNGGTVPSSFNTSKLVNPLGTKASVGAFKAQYCD